MIGPHAGIMIEPLFNNFATAAFFEFIVFAIFEMRFLLTVWRARRVGQTDAWQVRSYIYSVNSSWNPIPYMEPHRRCETQFYVMKL